MNPKVFMYMYSIAIKWNSRFFHSKNNDQVEQNEGPDFCINHFGPIYGVKRELSTYSSSICVIYTYAVNIWKSVIWTIMYSHGFLISTIGCIFVILDGNKCVIK